MKIGFIGLGIMGRPMAKNLLKAGYDLVVYDFNKDAVADLVSCGASAAESGKELASQFLYIDLLFYISMIIKYTILYY